MDNDTQEHLFNTNSSYNPVKKGEVVWFVVVAVLICIVLYVTK